MTVVELIYPVSLYPLRISDEINEKSYSVEDEEGFLDILKNILSSPKVTNAVKVLMAQAISSTSS